MSSNQPTTPGSVVPESPDEPTTAVCAATYYADLRDAYAFVFRVSSTRTRFTVYAPAGSRYVIGETYVLTLTHISGGDPTAPASVPR